MKTKRKQVYQFSVGT